MSRQTDAFAPATAERLAAIAPVPGLLPAVVVPGRTAGGDDIPFEVRKTWAGILYDRYGWITASNGALAAWSVIAAG
jgi:hypothetical protein